MILTPVSVWKNFEADLELLPAVLSESCEDGVKYERINFSGRDTGEGRVLVYGVLAYKESSPSKDCVLIFQDGGAKCDKKLLTYFVGKGYSAFFVDYSGTQPDEEVYTLYPGNVKYANYELCKESMDTVDDSVLNSCWYEWTALGVYARKFLCERFATDRVGLLGINDGGEIAWKLAYAADFSCAIVVNACGWRTYKGINKFDSGVTDFNENNYKFLAGLDSQAYAQFVKCPMLLLCSAGDKDFDYDRAYDTFSRINPAVAASSSIAFSLNCGSFIDIRSLNDMFLFLDSNVKKRHVFIPRPVDLKICTDENDNLIAEITCDKLGIVERCGVFLAEDDFDFANRNWTATAIKSKKNAYECSFFLNVYEKSKSVFALGYAVYSSGFTVWSKVVASKIEGRFRNSRAKSKIIYSTEFGPECFSSENCLEHSVGGVFLIDNDVIPKIESMCGLSGISSNFGLTTSRILSSQFSPDKESVLKLDVCSVGNAEITVQFREKVSGDIYYTKFSVLGDVWQSKIIEPSVVKNERGRSLHDFTECETFSILSDGKFVVNNIMWL